MTSVSVSPREHLTEWMCPALSNSYMRAAHVGPRPWVRSTRTWCESAGQAVQATGTKASATGLAIVNGFKEQARLRGAGELLPRDHRQHPVPPMGGVDPVQGQHRGLAVARTRCT